MKTFTMITRHGDSKENITAYTLISSDYQTVKLGVGELTNLLKEGKIKVNNLALESKGIVSTNGALDKYTFINNNTMEIVGTARAVILDRVEQNDKLLGYTAFTQFGTLVELNVVDATELAKRGLISNGKIRHTSNGDIVSSIGGNYPLRQIEMAKAPKGKITSDIFYFCTVPDINQEYFGAIISCTSATEMSKLNDVLSKSNAKLISEVSKVAGKGVRDSLGIKRMGANSIYGAFDIKVLEKFVGAQAEIKNTVSTISVSALKYENGPQHEVTEALVELDSAWGLKSKNYENDKLGEEVKRFTKEIVNKFGSVKVVK